MIGIIASLILLIQGIPVQQGGTVTGVLRDSQGMPVPGVRMAAVARGDTIEEAATGAAMAGLAETDQQGRFTLENIPPGRYSIAAGRLDLQTYYPGTQSLADATILTIAPGATISGITFVLNNTSVGRAPSIGGGAPSITALIPVRVIAENGAKIPISADGKLIGLKLEWSTNLLTIPIDAASFTVPGPVAAEFRVTVENLPQDYQVKSIVYGATPIPQGVFRLAPANFPTLVYATASPMAATSSTPPPSFQLLNFAQYSSASLRPAPTPPSPLTITLGVVSLSSPGVRVSGKIGTTDRRRVYISGRPGTVFSDGTFEFRDVPPGRHLIAAVGNGGLASVVVVGDKDVAGIELKEVFILPADYREPREPMPAGPYAPGTIVPLARVAGTVVEENTKVPILEGNVLIRVGDFTRSFPIDEKGRFETFYLLPGTYDFRLQIFGHSTNGPTVTVDDKDVTLELPSRRLY